MELAGRRLPWICFFMQGCQEYLIVKMTIPMHENPSFPASGKACREWWILALFPEFILAEYMCSMASDGGVCGVSVLLCHDSISCFVYMLWRKYSEKRSVWKRIRVFFSPESNAEAFCLERFGVYSRMFRCFPWNPGMFFEGKFCFFLRKVRCLPLLQVLLKGVYR